VPAYRIEPQPRILELRAVRGIRNHAARRIRNSLDELFRRFSEGDVLFADDDEGRTGDLNEPGRDRRLID
jgi:hypothetical protein